jgi:hypothetical protein
MTVRNVDFTTKNILYDSSVMKINFQDPAILIPVGVILIGLVLFFWAVGKLFKKSASVEDYAVGEPLAPNAGTDDLFSAAPIEDLPRRNNEFVPPPPETRPSPARDALPAVNKEMSERLDSMTQRLSDMQAVLQRQAGAVPAGSPLTPETIDKLLKIIGNVTQQVDALQRSLGATPTTPAATPAPGPSPAQPPRPAAAPATGAPGGKTIGVAGGALSGLGRTNPASPPGAGPINPPGK